MRLSIKTYFNISCSDLATLNTPQLIDKVKDLLEFAYQLGLEECIYILRLFLNNYKYYINILYV